MPKKRVVAFGLHEIEIAAARERLSDAEVTESFVVGEAEDAAIEELRARGLVVQELGTEERAPMARPAGPTTFAAGPRRTLRRADARPAPPTTYYRLNLKGPLLDPWRAALEQAGAQILEALSPVSLRARIPAARFAAVAALPFLTAPPEPQQQAAASLSTFDANTIAPKRDVTPVVPYDVLLTEEGARAPVLEWLKAHGMVVAGMGGRKIRAYAITDTPLIDELRDQTELVELVEEVVPPKLLNDVSRTLLGVDGAGAAAFPYDGKDQIVAIADTGLDDKHKDFSGRIVKTVARGRPGDSSDPNGHGTHVAGSVLGSGAESAGKYKGTAPAAKLFFQSLLDKDDGLGGLPLNLAELFEEAYQSGARIHNNSWGAATASTYRITSNEVDDFVRKHPDMLVVIAAGNEGTAAKPRNAKAGYVDWLSIGSPATCKNALTVGASRSSRAVGAYAPKTYGDLWGTDYPAIPIADEPVSGDPESMGAFSSRGPCDEYRIKPDVVAPGTDILSVRSSKAPLRNFWGGFAENDKYAYMGGTSMATPLVSGCAALVRQYYVSARTHQPSAALLKATLINGTRKLTGEDSTADYPDLPNYHQGFGAVHLPDTVPNPARPELKLEFFDNWSDPATQLKGSGRKLRFTIPVAAGGALRICMAYTDVPGRGVQNDLNLFLEVPGATEKLFGNPKVPRGFNGPDASNNVEIIRLDNAPAGNYTISIVAYNILKPPQDVALVVTGKLTGPLTRS